MPKFEFELSDVKVKEIASTIRDSTSDQMMKHLEKYNDYQVIQLAIKTQIANGSLEEKLIWGFPRRVDQIARLR